MGENLRSMVEILLASWEFTTEPKEEHSGGGRREKNKKGPFFRLLV